MRVKPKEYFQPKVFKELASILWQRYFLTGTFGKSVGIKTLKVNDLEPLRIFFGYTELEWERKKSVSIQELSQNLSHSVFQMTINQFVELVSGRKLRLKSVEEELYQKDFIQFKKQLELIDLRFVQWFDAKQIQKWFDQHRTELAIFRHVSNALNHLPQNYTRLPFFAYTQTGLPHYFDEDQTAGTILLQCLEKMAEEQQVFLDDALSATEKKNEWLARAHLLKDDTMNFVAAVNLVGYNQQQQADIVWQAASQKHQSWNIPLKELLIQEEVRPYSRKKVLIIENSGVYSLLLERFPELPMICSSGQFRYAVWVLLRKLVKSGTHLYYSGDIDPEGLDMAQNLINHLQVPIDWLGMNESDFQTKQTMIELSESRLKKLDKLVDPQLKKMAEKIKSKHAVVYQEGLIESMIDEIQRLFKFE